MTLVKEKNSSINPHIYICNNDNFNFCFRPIKYATLKKKPNRNHTRQIFCQTGFFDAILFVQGKCGNQEASPPFFFSGKIRVQGLAHMHVLLLHRLTLIQPFEPLSFYMGKDFYGLQFLFKNKKYNDVKGRNSSAIFTITTLGQLSINIWILSELFISAIADNLPQK